MIRSSVQKLKREISELILCILSDHYDLMLDGNNMNRRKVTNSWKLNNSFLNEKVVKTEIKDFL